MPSQSLLILAACMACLMPACERAEPLVPQKKTVPPLVVPLVETPAITPLPPLPEPEIVIAKATPASPLALYDAVSAGDLKLVEQLLRDGLPANMVTPEGDTPLCAALRKNQDELASLLVCHDADVNAPGQGGQRPLALVCLRRRPALMQLLLESGAEPNVPFAFPVSAELLISLTESLRYQLKRERNLTPLMVCAGRGDVEAVTLLLQHGASTYLHTKPSYRYALNFAADQRYLFVMRLLLGRDPETEPQFLITVDLSKQKAWVEKEKKHLLSTSISTGRRGYATPSGRYVITDKHKHWISTIYKVPMPYFMRLNCSAIGLHSGHVTGSPASHGCIRLPHNVAKKLYSLANVGDEVIIQR